MGDPAIKVDVDKLDPVQREQMLRVCAVLDLSPSQAAEKMFAEKVGEVFAPSKTEELWTIKDLAQRWSCGLKAARGRIARSGIQVVKIGGKTHRYRPADVRAMEAKGNRKPARLVS